MSSSHSNPAPPGAHGAWVTLDEAAGALRLSQQTLWNRLQELRIEVLRVEQDGRKVSALSRDDLERVAAAERGSRPTPKPAPAPEPPPAREAEPRVEPQPRAAFVEPDGGPRSLWQQLRELEAQRDQLDFELHIVRVQLADSRARAQHAEESARLLRSDLDGSRAETEHWRARCEPLEAERLRDAAELAAERERREVLERQLTRLIEVEHARERYCDRLEQRLNELPRLRRGA